MPVSAQERELATRELVRHHAFGRLADGYLQPRLRRVSQAATDADLALAFWGLPAPEFLRTVPPLFPTWAGVLLRLVAGMFALGVALGIGIAINAGSDADKDAGALVALSFGIPMVLVWVAGGRLLRHSRHARVLGTLAALLIALTGVGLLVSVPVLWAIWAHPKPVARSKTPGPEVPPPTGSSPHVPIATISIAVAITVLFVVEASAAGQYDIIASRHRDIDSLPWPLATLGLNGSAVAQGEWWRLVTAGFVHFDLRHYSNNLIALLFVGVMVESRYGTTRFSLIYVLGLIGGNLLQLPLSWNAPGIAAGASGAICGAFGALIVVGTRYRTERYTLAIASALLLVNLFYGFFLPGIAIAAHLGGAIAGTITALVVGQAPGWRARQASMEARDLALSEWTLDREEANWPPVPSVVNDPRNQLSFPLSDSYRLLYAAMAAGLVALALWGGVVAVRWGVRPLSVLVVLGALGALRLAARSVVGLRTAELRLTPLGFVTRLGRTERAASWIDISRFFVRNLGTWPRQEQVCFEFQPAFVARLPRGYGSFLASSGGAMLRYGGMSADDQADLLEEWRKRWVGAALVG